MTDQERLDMVKDILQKSVTKVSDTVARAEGYADRMKPGSKEKADAFKLIEEYIAAKIAEEML